MKRAFVLFVLGLSSLIFLSVAGAGQESDVRINNVSWPSRKAVNKKVLSLLPKNSIPKVSESPVPVLVPKKKNLLEQGVLIVEQNYYAFSSNVNGATISILATNVSHFYSLPDTDKPRYNGRIRGKPAFIGESEGIWHVSWNQYGVAYSLDIGCGTAGDSRCSKKHLMELGNNLAYIGGKGSANNNTQR